MEMKIKKNKKVELDLDVVDRLALISLHDHRNFLTSMLESGAASGYLHPEDLDRNSTLINAFSEVIKYYGDK